MSEISYEQATDEDLLRAYREGDSEAASVLIGKYKPLVLRLSAARFLAGGDREDLIQEGMIGLFKALRDYNETKGASFATFAALCANRQMLQAIESAQREKNKVLNDADSLSNEGMEQDFLKNAVSPEALVVHREAIDERIRAVYERLSPLEQKVLSMTLGGMDYKEIASILGKTPKSIDNALQRIRKKSKSEA